MRAKLLALVCCAFASACVAGCSDDDSGDGEEKLTFGLLAPFSGKLKGIGQSMQSAVLMAMDEINKSGGLSLADKVYHLALEARDDGTDATASLEEAEKLVKSEAPKVLALIGPATSGAAQAVADAMKDKSVINVSASATSPSLSGTSPYFYRTVASDVFQGAVAARYALAQGKTNAAILYIDNTYGKGLAAAFKDAFTKDGKGNVVVEVSYPEQLDYKNYDFTKEANDVFNPTSGTPDMVYLVSYNEDGAKFTSYAKQAIPATNPPLLFGCDGNKGPDFTSAADSSVIDGMIGTAPVPPADDSNYKAYKNRYYQTYKQDPKIFSEGTYDAVYLLAYALQKANQTPDRMVFDQATMRAVSGSGGGVKINVNEWKKGRAELIAGNEINYDGAGGVVDWDDKGDVASGVYEIWRWDGTKNEYEQVKTETVP